MRQGLPDPEQRQQLREIEKLKRGFRALRAQFLCLLAIEASVIVTLIIHFTLSKG